MFNKTTFIFAILLIAVVSSALNHRQSSKTKLHVTVLDNLGNYVAGATITIYSSMEDYEGNANRLIVGKTDKKGRFQYKGLEAKPYFLDVKKDNLRNDKESVPTGLLSDDKLNKVLVIIK